MYLYWFKYSFYMKKEKQLFKFNKSIANEYRQNYTEGCFTYYEKEKLLFIYEKGNYHILTTKENVVKALFDIGSRQIIYGKKTDLDVKGLQKLIEEEYSYPFKLRENPPIKIKRTLLFYAATFNLDPCYRPTAAFWKEEAKRMAQYKKEDEMLDRSMRMTPEKMRKEFTI